jgi:hypothetical protein
VSCDGLIVAVDANQLVQDISQRMAEIKLSIQKRNALTLVGGSLALVAGWKLYHRPASPVVASSAAPVVAAEQQGFLKKMGSHFSTIFSMTLASVLVTFITTDVFDGAKDVVRRFWYGHDNVKLFKILMNSSLLSVQSTLRRKNNQFDLADLQTREKYNSHLLAVSRYIVELVAVTLQKASAAQISLEHDAFLLISQLQRDVEFLTAECQSGKYCNLSEDAVVPAKKIFSQVTETVYRLEDLFYSFGRAADPADQGE